jgi:ribonuclease P protein component
VPRGAPAYQSLTNAKLTLQSLKGDAAFQRLRKGRPGRAQYLSLRWLPTQTNMVCVGIVTTRKVGKAVTRNLIRRRLREALRSLLLEHAVRPAASWDGTPSFDLVIIVRPEAAGASYATLKGALGNALHNAKVLT